MDPFSAFKAKNKRRIEDEIDSPKGKHAKFESSQDVCVTGFGDMGVLGMPVNFRPPLPPDADEPLKEDMTDEDDDEGDNPLVGAPVSNPALCEVQVKKIRCGGMHTAVVKTRDSKDILVTWGVNDDAVLGRISDSKPLDGSPSIDLSIVPQEVSFPEKIGIEDITVGDHHMCLLDDAKKIWVWGCYKDVNNANLLGRLLKTPVKINFIPSGVEIQKIASGASVTMALSEDGKVFMWGLPPWEKLSEEAPKKSEPDGFGVQRQITPEEIKLQEVQFPTRARIVDIWAGSYSYFALAEDGQLYSWGLNNYSQLGYKTEEAENKPSLQNENGITLQQNDMTEKAPRKVTLPFDGKRIVQISCGTHHTMLLAEESSNLIKLFTVGSSSDGQLGHGKGTKNLQSFQEIPFFTSLSQQTEPVKSITAVDKGSFAITKSGFVYAWGYNELYNLGLNDHKERWQPTRCDEGAVKGKRVTMVDGGGQFSVFVVDSSSTGAQDIASIERTVLAKPVQAQAKPVAKANEILTGSGKYYNIHPETGRWKCLSCTAENQPALTACSGCRTRKIDITTMPKDIGVSVNAIFNPPTAAAPAFQFGSAPSSSGSAITFGTAATATTPVAASNTGVQFGNNGPSAPFSFGSPAPPSFGSPAPSSTPFSSPFNTDKPLPANPFPSSFTFGTNSNTEAPNFTTSSAFSTPSVTFSVSIPKKDSSSAPKVTPPASIPFGNPTSSNSNNDYSLHAIEKRLADAIEMGRQAAKMHEQANEMYNQTLEMIRKARGGV